MKVLAVAQEGDTESGPLWKYQKETTLKIVVQKNDMEKAIKDLKRMVQRDGILKEAKKRRFYEKPSVKRKRKQKEAQRRRRKALRFKRPERD